MIISFLYKRSNATVSYFCDMNYQIPLNKMKQEKGITRREALKRMGLLMAGTAASITGVSTLTACDKVQRKRIILYFTGTGNCLYVARQLGDGNTQHPSNGQTKQVLFRSRRNRGCLSHLWAHASQYGTELHQAGEAEGIL